MDRNPASTATSRYPAVSRLRRLRTTPSSCSAGTFSCPAGTARHPAGFGASLAALTLMFAVTAIVVRASPLSNNIALIVAVSSAVRGWSR
jgi:hypothetical protein